MKIFIAMFLTFACAFSVHAQKQIEVTVTSTFLRKAPDSTAEKVQTVQKGDKLVLEKSQDSKGWYYASTAADRTVKGWIRKDTVGKAEAIAAVAEVVVQKPKPVEPKRVEPKRVESRQSEPKQVKPKQVEPKPIEPTTVAAPSSSEPERQPEPNILPEPKPAPQPQPSPSLPMPAPAVATIAPPAAVVAPSPAKTPEEEEEVIRVDTEEVSLSVRVVDANNRAVKNLNQTQFKVYEDDVLQTVTSVSTTEVPIISALVIDNSRSLRTQLKSIIEAGKIIVGTNRAADQSAVIRFVSADKIEVVQDFTASRAALDNGLNNLFVEGGQTAIIDAVYTAAKKIEQHQSSNRKDDIRLRALILVSDGDDRSSSHDEEQLINLLRQSQVQIYAVGFVNNLSKEPDAGGVNRQEKAKSLLTRLTQETGGRAYFPSSIDELAQIAAEISNEMHTQYLISYIPADEGRDGVFRKLNVIVNESANKEKRIVITRAGRISAGKKVN